MCVSKWQARVAARRMRDESVYGGMKALARIYDEEKVDKCTTFFWDNEEETATTAKKEREHVVMTIDEAVTLALKATAFFYWQHVGWPDSAIIDNATRFGERAYREIQHLQLCAADIVKALDELMLV